MYFITDTYFPVVLDACETWPVVLRGKYRERVFDNGELRR
jgi:hypothetical protein